MLDRIKQRINGKGWNLYQIEDQEKAYDAIPRGPADVLETGKQYLLCPVVEDPKDTMKVMKACEYFYKKMGIYPTIRLGVSVVAIPVLGFSEDDIKLRTDRDRQVMSNEEFYIALDTLSATTQRN